ncbi:MAG: alanine--tRNA ligase [Acidobacteriota bacterium]|nr:alanine--tRNA ligase [Acidobacteriota bacterium]MDE3092295.1 alanine--tRNA ligase [Acidobacteriota bacterium]MDE3146097.1 alanine--tRNA ligase [Acidobacteriota bacterium]
MEAAELRSIFLNYFADNGHLIVPSASLIPHDPSLLFTVAGMVPFKPYFLLEETPPAPRAVSIQKCFRAPDIDIIGTTQRHLTFFEMMGNFSFGDYFKEGAIRYAWGLITEGFGLDPDRLWITVHHSDDQAEELWRDLIGVAPERIQRLGEDNFWDMGETGPCGPCSEIFFDKGASFGADGGPAHGGEDRFIEFWNLVFMQFEKGPGGSMVDLPTQNIDTGAGFERVLSILNGVESVFATDLFTPLLETAARALDTPYGRDEETDVAIRRIAEHGRAMTMLVSDGVLPSNEGRGYVLRRIIRRAILAARRSGSDAALTAKLVDATVEKMGDAYPVLVKDRDLIVSILEREEAGFARTLRTGMALLEDARDEVLGARTTVFPGDVAFRLHDTHGFPIELTSEIIAESGLAVDRDAFDAAMTAQRNRARAAAKALNLADDAQYRELIERHGTTEFLGRDVDRYSLETTVVAILVGEDGTSELFLESTPFYAESGGQVGDVGVVVTESGRFEVLDTQNVAGGLFAHRGRLSGEILPGQVGVATIDAARREATRRNHTATHLLHSGLRTILGDHVRQQGSYVGPERLRFDFAHGEGVRREELDEILTLVNADVVANEPVETIQTSKSDAEKMGAIAFFGDKYGDRVRVVRAGRHSLEFCGGTHVARLGDIGQIQVVSESSIGANTRRIEAVSALGAFRRSAEMEGSLAAVAAILKSSMDEVVPSLERVLEHQRDLEKEVASLRQAQLSLFAEQLHERSAEPVLVARVDGYAGDQLRTLAQGLQRRGRRCVVLVGAHESKVAIAVASDDSLDASSTVKELAALVGGGGGGSPRLALAGGRDVEGIDRVLVAASAL